MEVRLVDVMGNVAVALLLIKMSMSCACTIIPKRILTLSLPGQPKGVEKSLVLASARACFNKRSNDTHFPSTSIEK